MADLTDKIEELVDSPAEIRVDGESTRERPISELIEADRYINAKKQAASTRPIHYGRFKSGGPV